MKKIFSLSLIITVILVLVGCKSYEVRLAEGIKEKENEIESIIFSSLINEYIESETEIEFEKYDVFTQEDTTTYLYNILIPINSEYLQLEPTNQYELLREVTKRIFYFQGDDNRSGALKGDSIIIGSLERIKFQSIILYFENKDDTYEISLDNEQEKATKVSSNFEINNFIFANIKNKLYVISNGGNILNYGEYIREGDWAYRKPDSSSVSSTTSTTSTTSITSTYWSDMNGIEKKSKISNYLIQIKNEGYSIRVDEDYFRKALDEYFDGGYTNETSIKEAILMVGLAGGGIYK